MSRIIYDCDNTMGIKERDVDDGLTLLYLLGREDVELHGITTTYGNSTIDAVYENTINMMKELGRKDIPVLKGGSSPHDRQSEAASFLCEKTSLYPGDITILATGSLTNLLGAYELDRDFFRKVKEIILMGGVTEPLIINGKLLSELNFSCDAEASYKVLNSGAKLTVITGHLCLQALFGEEEYRRLTENNDLNIFRYINAKTCHWFSFIKELFGIQGFYNWDIVAAVYLTNPGLFDENTVKLSSTVEDLKSGLLKLSGSSCNINMPTTIKDKEGFNETVFSSWANVDY